MKDLVDKFLSWPLPASVCSDLCVTMQDYPHRSGTNLLTATEAELMLEYVVGPIIQENAILRAEIENLKPRKSYGTDIGWGHNGPCQPDCSCDIAKLRLK
jgi:hypothetical protein